jgi:hypothetical protein
MWSHFGINCTVTLLALLALLLYCTVHTLIAFGTIEHRYELIRF